MTQAYVPSDEFQRMPIFSNRVLYALLEQLKPVLSEQKRNSLLGDLGSDYTGNGRIGAEWELVVLHRLGTTGSISLPSHREGAGNLDAVYTDSATGEKVLIEVTAVSDHGLHAKNPIELFQTKLFNSRRKRPSFSAGGIHYEIGHRFEDGHPVLGIPAPNEMDAFFTQPTYKAFLQDIDNAPDKQHIHRFEARGSASHLTFVPGYGGGGHYISFNVIQDIHDNYVTKALDRKDDQIKRASTDLPAVVIVCDGDCAVMRQRQPPPGKPGFEDVVEEYLNGQSRFTNRLLSFTPKIPKPKTDRMEAIISIAVVENHQTFRQRTRKAQVTIFPKRGRPNVAVSQKTIERIAQSVATLPPFVKSPGNARRHRNQPWYYGGYRLGGELNKLTVRISLLALQDLLTGKIKQEDFLADHEEVIKSMSLVTSLGKMISAITIEPTPEHDDDWVEIQFGNPDPRASFPGKKKP